jgi:hypothetical protein
MVHQSTKHPLASYKIPHILENNEQVKEVTMSAAHSLQRFWQYGRNYVYDKGYAPVS